MMLETTTLFKLEVPLKVNSTVLIIALTELAQVYTGWPTMAPI
jgi:hypothetical protein